MGSRGYEEAVERWGSALKQAAGRLARRALPGLAVAALEVDATRLVSQEIPRLFSRQLRQIDPSLNEDLLDLYGASEQALSHHFAFLNRPHRFQAEIDWQVREGRAWLGELHAFDYALDLALTYRISGEDRYARHLRHLIAHWIAENPPPGGAGWLPTPLARRVHNWILAADLARADWERDTEFRAVVSHSLALQCAYLTRQARSPLTLDEVRALLLAGRFFAGSAGAELRIRAHESLLEQLNSGRYLQASPGSHLQLGATILEFLLFESEPDEAGQLKQGLRKTLQILEATLLPDGSLPLFGPPARVDFADLAALAAVSLADSTWKGLAGKFGILPYMLLGEEGKLRFESLPDQAWQADRRLLPESGVYRLSGADSSALVASVVTGPADASPEALADDLSFELSIQKHRVIVSSRAYSPQGEAGETESSTARGQNTLWLDGAPIGASLHCSLGPPPRQWESGPGFTGLVGPERRLAAPKLSYRRAWHCLDGRCWVILESLKGQGSHAATSLLHFYPTFQIELLPDRAIARSRVLAVTVIPFGPTPAQMTLSRGDDGEFPGWYAPGLGAKYPASVLACRWRDFDVPWVGGQIIIPGTEAAFRAAPPDLHAGTITLELSGTCYHLPFL